jgi:hypothetical protein
MSKATAASMSLARARRIITIAAHVTAAASPSVITTGQPPRICAVMGGMNVGSVRRGLVPIGSSWVHVGVYHGV